MLEVNNIMVFFENALALNDLTIEVQKGEVIGILGSNSAGKTTLMNTISGLLSDMKVKEDRRDGVRITLRGQIRFEGEDITDLKPSARVRKGIVLTRERHPVFRDSNILENLKIGGYLNKNNSKARQQIELVLEIFPHLKNLLNRKAGFLSGGEQQMLCIGMALMAKPRLLLMDEPFLGLSPLLQSTVVKSITEIRNEGITVVVSEQFARPLMPVIDRGYIIENGMLSTSGTTQDLMDNPEVKSSYLGI